MWFPLPATRSGGAQLAAVTALRSGLLAATSPFGVVTPAGSSPRPRLWFLGSAGGWERLSDSAAFAGVPEQWIDSIHGFAADRSGLLAVGAQMYFDASTANAEAWTSTDGTTWRRAIVEHGTDATMDFVYPVTGGYVAAGTDGYSFHAGMERGTAIWTSADGARWTRLAGAEVPGHVAISSVAQGAGRYVAVGEALPPGGTPSSAVSPIWTSPDGIHFTPERRSSIPADALIRRVFWTGKAFVAVGVRLTVGAFAWRSTDGVTWVSSTLPPGSMGARQVLVSDAAFTPTTLLAVGTITDAGGLDHPAVWESADGARWKVLPLPGGFDAIHFGQVFVAHGQVFMTGETAQGGFTAWMLDPGVRGP